MSKTKEVTIAQAMDFRQMAIAKGVSRAGFQLGLTDGIFSAALDAVRIAPPLGGRVYFFTVARRTDHAQVKLVLVNPGPKSVEGLSKVVVWAEQYGFKQTDVPELLAIREHRPRLHHELGMRDLMYVIATKECFLNRAARFCCVRWKHGTCEVHTFWSGDLRLAPLCAWFAFVDAS